MLRALTVAAAFLISATGVASASDADFKLRNKTGYQIDEVYVAPHSSSKWGSDLMGSDALADGQTLNVTFPHGNGACRFDIRVKYRGR